MKSTASYHPALSPSLVPPSPVPADGPLLDRYRALVEGEEFTWATRCQKVRLLGTGGQGSVFLAQRQGADGFTLPVALKVFSPESYRDARAYDEDMGRIAGVAARVALIQQDNLLYVHDFEARDGVRVMGMEWVDGYDLRQLLTAEVLARSRQRLRPDHWRYVNDVILTAGPCQPRLKPGVAIQVLRDCLAALAALHREGITHGDLKPSNVMLKRTGSAKLIDIGSAMDLRCAAGRRVWSPAYAAPEVLEGGPATPRADLASLGYILVEMLAGQAPFEGLTTYQALREAKRALEARLPQLLPKEVSGNEMLVYLCRRLVATDPARRFSSAQAADLGRKGAADFHRQLVKGDLASEYDNDLRVWLEQLG
jgi:serine/threonine-protein kinase